jgi:AraC-like DNA-binding protein
MLLIQDILVIPEAKVRLYIKYMVSLRCKLMVIEELKQLGIKYVVVDLGVVKMFEEITAEKRILLKENLLKSGLELLDDKRSIIIERIQNAVVQMIHYSDELPKTNYSEFISQQLDYDYTYLANMFAEVKGITLQKYIISHRIEKVKEFLLYDELNLTEIANRLKYSSVTHLSSQFKKITGLTPTFYKQLKCKREVNLENL